jgi:hypothetical protein
VSLDDPAEAAAGGGGPESGSGAVAAEAAKAEAPAEAATDSLPESDGDEGGEGGRGNKPAEGDSGAAVGQIHTATALPASRNPVPLPFSFSSEEKTDNPFSSDAASASL